MRQEELTGKTAEQMKSEVLTNVTTDTALENSGALKNNFDKDKVQSEINLQVDVTKQFKVSPNGGAVPGSSVEKNVKVGEILDRFGPENGRYLASPKDLLEQRALPPGTN